MNIILVIIKSIPCAQKAYMNLSEEQSNQIQIRCDHFKTLCKVHKDRFYRLTRKQIYIRSLGEDAPEKGSGKVSMRPGRAKVPRLVNTSAPRFLDRLEVQRSFPQRNNSVCSTFQVPLVFICEHKDLHVSHILEDTLVF